MKNLILSFSALFITFVSYAQVGIGVTTPHASAALEVVATNNDKGILITRLTKSQRDAISAPATGLLVYQTDNSPGLYFFNGISWAAVGKDNLGNHLLTQSLNLNGEAIKDNTDDSTELTIQSLVNEKDVHIKSYDEIYLTTINGDDGVTQDPLGTVYDTYGDIELTSAGGIILEANEEVLIESGSSDDIDIIASDDLVLEALGDDVLIDADDDIKLNAGNDGSGEILVYDPIGSPSGDNIILDSGNDIELKVTSGDFVEIWEDGVFLYTLPGSRGAVGQFMQRSSDGSSEFYSDWSAYALPLADGTSGQILTTDGSGSVTWTTPASALNDLSDARTYGINSITIGHTTTGQLFSADYNVAVGVNSLMSITQGTNNTAVGDGSVKLLTTGKHNVAVGKDALNNLSTSSYNTAVGYQALTGLKSGANNIAIGDNAGGIITQVSNNIFIGEGPFAGGLTDSDGDGEKTLGDDNIYIGNNVNPKQEDVSNEIVIGAGATGNGTNTITLGHTTNDDIYARGNLHITDNVYATGTVSSGGTVLTSDRRLKTDIKSVANGLSTVMKLNPVSYKKRLSFDTGEYNKKEIGFIAQEVQEILPDLVSVGPDENKTLSLDYNSLIPILTKAIQEQQVLIEALKAKVERLESNN